MLIDQWAKLSRRVVRYPGGEYNDGTGYKEGRTLLLGGQQVMDTFEYPWCRETVDLMFRGLELNYRNDPLNIVENGRS